MKKLICLLLTLSLTLGLLTISYAQDADIDTLSAADVNGDGDINILDLTLIAAHFGQTVTADQDPNPDVNGDGIVNILDLTSVAGNFGKTVRPPVVFVSADPAINSQLEVNSTITLTFDNTPDDLTVSTGAITVTGNTATITGPFDPGALALTVTWADGSQTLNYTIRPPVSLVSTVPVSGATLDEDDTIILTFDNMPEDVTVSPGTVTVTGQIAIITGPFDPGALSLTVTWMDGTQALNYTIRQPVAFVSADPASDAKLVVDDTITLTFDNTPEDVTVSAGTATIIDETVTITGPFTPGALALTVTWLDGSETFNYTIRQPAEFVSANPASNSLIAVDDTITLTFDHMPEDVTVSTGTATITDKTVEITGPFIPGPLALLISWADGASSLVYVVHIPDTESPKITGGTVNDGDRDVDPEAINSSLRIEVEFSEEVTGNIALQTEAGDDVGWLGKVDGNKGILELVRGKDIGHDITYAIVAKVSDAAGNAADLKITFATQSRTSGIPFAVTDATFDSLVLKSTIPVIVEFWKDG